MRPATLRDAIRRIVGLVVGATVIVVVAAVAAFTTIGDLRSSIARLSGIVSEANALSTSSDALLIGPVTSEAYERFVRDAQSLVDDLAPSSLPPGPASEAQAAVERLRAAAVAVVDAAFADPDIDPSSTAPGRVWVAASEDARRVAQLGTELDQAMERLRLDVQRRAERRLTLATSVVAGVSVLAGLAVVLLVALVRRRVVAPVEHLVTVTERVTGGDMTARASVTGDGEVARLGGALNQMLDEISASRDIVADAAALARLGGWRYDPEAGEMTWSDAVYDIHEVERGTRVDPERGIEFYVPEDRPRIAEAFRNTLETGDAYDGEFRIVTTSGRTVWVRATGQAVKDPAGRLSGVSGAFQDIDARKRQESEARAIESMLRSTIERLRNPYVLVGPDLRVTFANTAATDLAVVEVRDAVVGERLDRVFPDLLSGRIVERIRETLTTQTALSFEVQQPTTLRWYDAWADPNPSGVAIGLHDVTQRHDLIDQLAEKEARLQYELRTRASLDDEVRADIAIIDGDARILSVNAGWVASALRTATPGDMTGRPVMASMPPIGGCLSDDVQKRVQQGIRTVLDGSREQYIDRLRCTPNEPDSGGDRWFSLTVAGFEGSAGQRNAVVMRIDDTDRELERQALERVAFHDPLTGTLSRDGLVRAVTQRAERSGWPDAAALAIMDVGGLRDINEAFGFRVGDALLEAVAQRLRQRSDDRTLIGRLRGEAFVMLLGELGQDETPSDRLFGEGKVDFEDPFVIEGLPLAVAPQIGFTRFGSEIRPVEALIREAEVALHVSQETGVTATEFDAQQDVLAQERTLLTHELRTALDQDQLELHFQPKVDLATGSMVAAEALVRWRHPTRGLVPPGQFIPVAEQTGLIVPLGRWVLDRAAAALRGWRDAGLRIVQVSVNVSAAQLTAETFVDDVDAALERHGIAASELILEVTESVFAGADDQLRATLRALHERGVALALDDFGTGYSSLAYLKDYPFDHIKIDMAFVHGLPDDEFSLNIVRSVLAIASAKGAITVAEGIERENQRASLVSLGCPRGQGFLFSAPLGEEDFSWLLERHPRLPLAQANDA